ncbi:hypothetical protein NliqN6_2698 [Naganishia liquefaciens]|uniref:Uncharacterized protein n=1 Tax=Naganishia liquefaciens TaxID=104408 RepID=A0A8H3TRW0_9TREE|nr:hypothetical protein NliqN6_2698 [Naganishia liquefaciens]
MIFHRLPRARTIAGTARSSSSGLSKRRIFGLGWWTRDKKQPQSSASPPSIPSPLHTPSPSPPTNPHPHPPDAPSPPKPSTTKTTSSLSARDEEIKRKLLDMDGGNAGFGYEGGKPEGGQGRETRRNMFRIM